MYGLPQAGKLANIHLQNLLEPHGYHPCPITPGLWMHTTHDIQFTLVVNDLAIQYTAKADGENLLTALKGHYQVTEDWVASWYCRLTLTWDYTKCTVDLAMQDTSHVPSNDSNTHCQTTLNIPTCLAEALLLTRITRE